MLKKKSKNTTHFNSSQNKSYYSGTSLWFIYEYSIFEPTLRFRNFFPYSYAMLYVKVSKLQSKCYGESSIIDVFVAEWLWEK